GLLVLGGLACGLLSLFPRLLGSSLLPGLFLGAFLCGLGGLFTGLLGSCLLLLFLGLLPGHLGLPLLFGRPGLLGLFRLGLLLRRLSLFGRLGFLLFRCFLLLLLLLFGFHLFHFILPGAGLLGFAGNFLSGLGSSLALRLQLVQGRLNNGLGWRQLRCEVKADKQHGKQHKMDGHGPDGRPEVAFRGGANARLLHQGASVISPTLPTPACCRPPITAITEP